MLTQDDVIDDWEVYASSRNRRWYNRLFDAILDYIYGHIVEATTWWDAEETIDGGV